MEMGSVTGCGGCVTSGAALPYSPVGQPVDGRRIARVHPADPVPVGDGCRPAALVFYLQTVYVLPHRGVDLPNSIGTG